MENVLTAFVIIFIILFAVLTLSESFITAQDNLAVTWQETEARRDDQANTHLSIASAHTSQNGAQISVAVLNDGNARLIDFSEWDIIIHYYDNNDPTGYHIQWLPYTSSAPVDTEWTVEGIYQDVSNSTPETYEPGVLNPGEIIMLQVHLLPSAEEHSAAQIVLSLPNGVNTSTIFTTNALPVVTANQPLIIANGGAGTITANYLTVSDVDDAPANLIYTITTAPEQGILNLMTFTQQDIADGLLQYTHTGSGDDGFGFVVSDGKDTSSTYTFNIVASLPPVIIANTTLAAPNPGTWEIDMAHLEATDPDDGPHNLVYTILIPPAHGTLSLGDTFTQEDINNGLLRYMHTGITTDAFQFKISDGKSTVGNYVFNITN